ncbi:MAG: hypothetical protein V3R33_00240, partial [Anaerolineales bacterium]
SLMIDGSDCPGCNSAARFCQETRTEIRTPLGVDSQTIVDLIKSNLGPGEKETVGVNSPDSFFLDIGKLPQVNQGNVIGLLSATSSALHHTGITADTGAAMTAAHDILSE